MAFLTPGIVKNIVRQQYLKLTTMQLNQLLLSVVLPTRWKYNNFDEDQREAKIGRVAVENGIARAIQRFMANVSK